VRGSGPAFPRPARRSSTVARCVVSYPRQPTDQRGNANDSRRRQPEPLTPGFATESSITESYTALSASSQPNSIHPPLLRPIGSLLVLAGRPARLGMPFSSPDLSETPGLHNVHNGPFPHGRRRVHPGEDGSGRVRVRVFQGEDPAMACYLRAQTPLDSPRTSHRHPAADRQGGTWFLPPECIYPVC
jgi:hypothetical protein